MTAKKVDVKQSKPHKRKGGWIRGHWRKGSKSLTIKKHTRNPPKKKKKKKTKTPGPSKKRTSQTTLAKPRGRPAQRSMKKAK